MNKAGHFLCPAALRCEEHPEHDFYAVPTFSRSGVAQKMHCEGFSFEE